LQADYLKLSCSLENSMAIRRESNCLLTSTKIQLQEAKPILWSLATYVQLGCTIKNDEISIGDEKNIDKF